MKKIKIWVPKTVFWVIFSSCCLSFQMVQYCYEKVKRGNVQMVLRHLKTLFYSQLDGPDETKIGPLFKKEHWNPISSHSDSSQKFKPTRPYFLARHFGEKLIQMPSRQATALNIYITDDILTDLFGRYNKESGEYKNQVSNTRDILESFTNDIVQNPAIIDTIIFKNKNFLNFNYRNRFCHIIHLTCLCA